LSDFFENQFLCKIISQIALLRGKICFLLHENMSLGKKNLGFCADLKIENEPCRQHAPRKSINYKKT
jgi:hypothetical protein